MTEVFKVERSKDGEYLIYVNGVKLESIQNKEKFLAVWKALQAWYTLSVQDPLSDILPDVSIEDEVQNIPESNPNQ